MTAANTLTATSRFNSSSRARSTTPIPPSPILASRRYWPSFSPIMVNSASGFAAQESHRNGGPAESARSSLAPSYETPAAFVAPGRSSLLQLAAPQNRPDDFQPVVAEAEKLVVEDRREIAVADDEFD